MLFVKTPQQFGNAELHLTNHLIKTIFEERKPLLPSVFGNRRIQACSRKKLKIYRYFFPFGKL